MGGLLGLGGVRAGCFRDALLCSPALLFSFYSLSPSASNQQPANYPAASQPNASEASSWHPRHPKRLSLTRARLGRDKSLAFAGLLRQTNTNVVNLPALPTGWPARRGRLPSGQPGKPEQCAQAGSLCRRSSRATQPKRPWRLWHRWPPQGVQSVRPAELLDSRRPPSQGRRVWLAGWRLAGWREGWLADCRLASQASQDSAPGLLALPAKQPGDAAEAPLAFLAAPRRPKHSICRALRQPAAAESAIAGWLAVRLAVWLAGLLVGWLVGWLAGWSVGWLVGWLAGQLVGELLAGGLVGWRLAWLAGRRQREPWRSPGDAAETSLASLAAPRRPKRSTRRALRQPAAAESASR